MAASSTLAAATPPHAGPLASKPAMAPARGAPTPIRSAAAQLRLAPAPARVAPASTRVASTPPGEAGISAGPAAMPTPATRWWPRKGLSRSVALPLAAAGLAVLLPWRAIDVLHQWQALSTPAEAAQTQPAAPPHDTAAGPASAPSGTPAAVQKLPASPQPAAIDTQHAPDGRLLAEIAQRAAALDQRDDDLQTRAAQVATAERLARQQIAELTRLRQQIEKLVAHESEASEADINLLVGLYSNMKPAQAAAVLGRLEAPQAAEILQRLDVHAAGPVLAAMDPAAALAITQVLANRRMPFRH